MCRAKARARTYEQSGRRDTLLTHGRVLSRLPRNNKIHFLTLTLHALLRFSFNEFVSFFYVPSKPHAHGCARLKIWNQCDQNGCYGRAPVYRTVSIRPGAGPRYFQGENSVHLVHRTFRGTFCVTGKARKIDLCSFCARAEKKGAHEGVSDPSRVQIDGEETCRPDEYYYIIYTGEPRIRRPGREIDAFSCLHAALYLVT